MRVRKRAALSFGIVVAMTVPLLLAARPAAVPKNVAYVSEQQGAISVIDLDTLQVIKKVNPQKIAPRGLGVTFDGRYLVAANKDTADASVFDTTSLDLIRRIPIGPNPEFLKFHPSGKWFFTSYEPESSGGPPGKDAGPPKEPEKDEDEQPSQIVQVSASDWSKVGSFEAGIETEGIEFSPDGKNLLVANEAQDTIGVYAVETGKIVRKVDLASSGKRPRGIKVSPKGDSYAVTMEVSGTLLSLDQNLNVIHSVATAAGPYGVAFDREGKRIFVAAARAQKLQVFAADSMKLLAEVPVGQRCWHFTFTPDDSKILVACGRSNDIYVIDAKSYQPIRTIEGFQVPWGLVTYPRSYGSLDLP